MSGNGVQEKFEPGDIVYLKSGSPPLTVEEVDIDIKVRWYAGEKMRHASFPPVCLTKEKHRLQDIPPKTPSPKRKQSFE